MRCGHAGDPDRRCTQKTNNNEEIIAVKDGAYKYRSIFVRFMTMREKQILARAIGIQKENSG